MLTFWLGAASDWLFSPFSLLRSVDLTMYDIDPPSPVLRLSAPRKATQPTALTDRQHMAQREQVEVRIINNVTVHAQSICTAEALGRIIDRHRTLARADGVLAQRIDLI